MSWRWKLGYGLLIALGLLAAIPVVIFGFVVPRESADAERALRAETGEYARAAAADAVAANTDGVLGTEEAEGVLRPHHGRLISLTRDAGAPVLVAAFGASGTGGIGRTVVTGCYRIVVRPNPTVTALPCST